MGQHILIHPPHATTAGFLDRVIAERAEYYGASDQLARLRMVVAAIPDDADLDDETDVVRALYAARLCNADFGDLIDDAIAAKREQRR